MLRHVDCPRLAYDSNKYLIFLWQKVQQGWIPPTDVSAELYKQIKTNPDNYPEELVGFVAYACSFGAAWFNGYAKNNANRNYAAEGSRAILKFADKIKGVKFETKDYRELDFKDKLIYADPPYANTKQYKAVTDTFNHDEFWQWCRDQSKRNRIYISEYAAPEDFECIGEINRLSTMDPSHMKVIEKVFTYNG